ncbi:glycosyltransferase family 1 protein [Scleroderma citrinum Foug A]|uniref:sterol 3beta-glucosyltransferase n=1 Tax=Scleroderma citrinum Foug A TaxID=1036808 RepID=A0A0C3EGJ0_9AGAM|nr:glycosyltransferase family 1 protein [Scleroderma citrinum Foug A]
MSRLVPRKARSPIASPVHQDVPLPDGTEQGQDASPQERIRRLATKTIDLGKCITGRPHPPPPASKGSRRIPNTNKKGKGKETSREDPTEAFSHSTPLSQPQSREHTSIHQVSSPASSDDSPFIRPPSPPSYPPHRPSLQEIQGVGSMRVGTQTLIQALQALPWGDDPDNEDDPGSATTPNIDSDDDTTPHIASSIHAIYHSVEWARRAMSSLSIRSTKRLVQGDLQGESDSDAEMNLAFEDDVEVDDFETATPRPADIQKPEPLPSAPLHMTVHLAASIRRRSVSRSGSMATVKVNRRALLAEKLREIFDIDALTEVWAEMPCWLFRSVLLQGYMYLTNSHLCFFAHMPSREGQVLKSGSLSKKATRTKRWIKYWFVLKNDALSWYQSSSDPYFLSGIVDLRYVLSCESVGERDIILRTTQKTVTLSADSVPSREEWLKAICKVIFKAQNMGDTVKIAIPYRVIVDVEKSSAFDFSETIEVKIVDKDEKDSYFFAYFHDIQAALEHIRDAVRLHRALDPGSPQVVLDTTAARPTVVTAHGIDRARSLPTAESKGSYSFRLSHLLRPFHDPFPLPLGRAYSAPDPPNAAEEYEHISKRGSFVPVATSAPGNDLTSPITNNPVFPADSSLPLRDHTYPPSSSPGESSSSSQGKILPLGVPWNVGVPSWLRSARRTTAPGGSVSLTVSVSQNLGSVHEIYSSPVTSFPDQSNGAPADLGYSVLETTEAMVDGEIMEKFRTAFAFDDKEVLLAYFSGYLYRLLPVSGRLYVSSNYFCFKSTGPLSQKTRMILPLRDILNVEKSKATGFGHVGLIVVIKGHEELFFEFGTDDRRSAFISILERQLEDTRKRPCNVVVPKLSEGQRHALILEEFDPRLSSSDADPVPAPENMSESLPAVMFTSASSTFLTFKPKESLHFTFLTIGSRGDVQPYISLAKGLIADGHRCKIATHGEFQAWIESYGIEYGYVGGDPAELMRICVENGTFTVSFLKEGLLKFRGWLDDLLKTCWEACQGTDVLVESPSAMGGYHIAEALRIPYFRAFTMTWTRTRAYPHSFAVPEHKMGGGYNYMSYVMFDQVFWRAISGQINRWRRNVLHLDNTSLDRMEPHKIPFLYNFSPTVVPPPLDWPEWIRITGYWFLDDAEVGAKKWTPPDDLISFIDSAHQAGKKVVYIGFGSIVVPDPEGMTRCVIDAVTQSGVYAILSKGWSDRLHAKSSEASKPEEPLPKQIYPITSIPHDWLFQRIDAACHHGGAGTTGASLRAGIPTIIKPFFGDQFFWADRVEALGIGAGVRKLTVESLKDALVSATTDQKQIDRARLIGKQIRSEKGVEVAIEAIYRDLEYARSLIKRPPSAVEEVEQGPTVSEDPVPRPRYDSAGSHPGSEDWSVISDLERRSSFGSRRSDGKIDPSSLHKRNSLTAAMMSVLPDSFTSQNHRRCSSASCRRA